jgi:vitamin B12 transporter
VSLQSDVRLAHEQIATFGADFLDDNVKSSTAFDRTSRDNSGVFGEYQVGIGKHRLSASARYDDNQQFGGHTTGNAGWKWQVSPNFYAMSGWGKAFRAPSFNDLYFPNFSNPLLRPERSTSYEVGFGGNLGSRWNWSANLYRTDIRDLIDLDSTSFLPSNVSSAQIEGLELESRLSLGQTDLSLNYAYTDPRNKTAGANSDKVLQRRARHSGNVRITQQMDSFRLGAVTRIQGTRYRNVANTAQLGSYVTFDLLGEYALSKQWQFDAKIINVTDKRYDTVYLYNEPGREFFVAAGYRFR